MESGTVITLEPGLRRVLAPNPSPMTFHGTNTYLLGDGEVAVIDPGPDNPLHRQAIFAALGPGERITQILVTHSHLDHSPAAAPLAAQTGAEVLAAGPSDWGLSPTMRKLKAQGGLGGGEGIDPGFQPTRQVSDGDLILGPWGSITVLETPGHMANHLSFAWRDALFSGDLVMGWSTSLVSPPDGDMMAFMVSLERLAQRSDRIYYPGHGDPVLKPQERCAELIAHRRGRERQILSSLEHDGPGTACSLARRIYTELTPALLPAATRNVMAHLIDLKDRNMIFCAEGIHSDSEFFLAEER